MIVTNRQRRKGHARMHARPQMSGKSRPNRSEGGGRMTAAALSHLSNYLSYKGLAACSKECPEYVSHKGLQVRENLRNSR